MGVKIPSACGERELFQEIFRAETIKELGNFTQEVFYCCLESFQKKERGYSSNIEKAIEFIQANYMRELSIDDVAASVFFHPVIWELFLKKRRDIRSWSI